MGVNAEVVGETGVVSEDWEAAIERAQGLDGAAARRRVEERFSVRAVFPRWWDAIQSTLAL